MQLGHDPVDDGVEVVADHAGSQPEAVDPVVAPLEQPIGELAGCADEDRGVRTVRVAVELVEVFLAPLGRHAVVVEEHDEVGEHLQRACRPFDGLLGGVARRRSIEATAAVSAG